MTFSIRSGLSVLMLAAAVAVSVTPLSAAPTEAQATKQCKTEMGWSSMSGKDKKSAMVQARLLECVRAKTSK